MPGYMIFSADCVCRKHNISSISRTRFFLFVYQCLCDESDKGISLTEVVGFKAKLRRF